MLKRARKKVPFSRDPEDQIINSEDFVRTAKNLGLTPLQESRLIRKVVLGMSYIGIARMEGKVRSTPVNLSIRHIPRRARSVTSKNGYKNELEREGKLRRK